MATRNISTRLAVEGESQYKAAISSVNAELRNMQSALKMTESQYKSNANSSEALTAKGKALNDLLTTQKSKVSALEAGLKNAQNAEQQYAQKKADLTRKIEDNVKALEELKKKSGDTTDEQKKLTDENERLNAELEQNEGYLTAARKATNNWQTDLNKAKTAVNETQAAIDENTAALERNSGGAKKDGDAFDALAARMIASGLKQTIEEITKALRECVDASVEFESSMAGVAKTTDLTDAELQAMGEEIKTLTTKIPIANTELAGIVETAGQLGISKENLVGFSTVMADLGVATNLTSEEAATLLARFANVTKMDPSNYENLGSVIVMLGNNMATTESEIVTMGQRLSAAGTLAGLTEQEIMALSASMSSVGIEAEAGGTAMSQTLAIIEKAVATGGDKVAKFADIAGMSADDFSASWQNKPIEAIQAFITGLGHLDEQGESAVLALDELGLSGIRQSNMLKSLGLASDVLADSVKMANTAWAENTALAKEAATRYETTESKITMYKNSVTNLEIAVGDQLTPALAELAETGTDVNEWAAGFVQENEWLVPTLTSVTAALATVTTILSGTIIVVKVIIPLLAKLNGTLLTNPYFLIATAIAGVVAALITLAATLPSTTEEADRLNESMEDTAKAFEEAEGKLNDTTKDIEATSVVIDKYVDRLDELNEKTSLTAEEQAEYNSIVSILRDLLPDVSFEIDDTTGKLITTTDELRKGAEAWKEYAKQQAFATIFAEQQAALVELSVSLEKARMELSEYNATATQGSLDYVAALEAERAAHQVFADAVVESGGRETEAVTAARDAWEAAGVKTGEVLAQISADEARAGAAMDALNESIADTEAQLDSQSETLLKTQQQMDDFEASMSTAAETTGQMADNVESASETLGSLGDGAGESAQQIPAAVGSALEETKAEVASATPEITAAVSDIGTQAATGFQSELGGMVDATTQALSDVNQAISSSAPDAYNAGYSVGSNIALGAEAGIMSYAYLVAQEAAQMVTDAINAAKLAADSNSPSKKTMQLGRDLDKGLVLGIKEQEDEILDTIKSTMEKVAGVQVEIPEIPDNTDAIIRAMSGGRDGDDKVADALNRLAKKKSDVTEINVNQTINAENTSYAGQQRAAAKEMKQIARELNR